MEGKGASRDLMEIEYKDLSSPSSALESTLLVCKDKKKTKSEEPPPSRPTIGPVPKSQFHDKLKGFLRMMAESNKILEEKAKENPEDFDIETVKGDDKSDMIEMDLMLGVADLHTPEAVRAAEAAIARNGLVTASGDSSSDDEDEMEEDSSGEESSRKQTKIIVLA